MNSTEYAQLKFHFQNTYARFTFEALFVLVLALALALAALPPAGTNELNDDDV